MKSKGIIIVLFALATLNVSARDIKSEMGITMLPDSTVQWMQNDKIGMFIHWGLYSGVGKGEWYQENKGVKPEEYRKLAYPQSGNQYFDASKFDAGAWARAAKLMGARYMIMVTEHHDGYALFESHYTNAFTSKQTHNRDFVREYVDSCRSAGLKVGLYKTLINWRYPGYYDVTGTNCEKNNFGYVTDINHKENARIMKEELYCQVKELLTNYGKIDLMFWDGGWLAQKKHDADAAYFWEPTKYLDPNNQWTINPLFQDIDTITGKPLGLMGIARKYQPDMAVNPRSGWMGDYTCEEGNKDIVGGIRKDLVMKCFAITGPWGWTPAVEDTSKIMSLDRMKKMVADCVIRNMILAINVSPDRHGVISHAQMTRLGELGAWINQNRDAIYGTKGGPWNPEDNKYGFCSKGNKLFVYLLDGYNDATFTLPALPKGIHIKRAYTTDTKTKIQISKDRTIPLKKNGGIRIITIELNKAIM
jgi:alpha-L-fucosidase